MSVKELADQVRTIPARVAEVVVDLPDERLRARPGPGEWSAIEVVGHLVDKLEHWARRAATTAREDNPSFEPYDQDECVRAAAYQRAVIEELLGRLIVHAERFARVIDALSDSALARPARHGEYGQITLRECVTLPIDSVAEHLEQAKAAATA